MSAKIRILSTGTNTLVELGGKTIGTGVEEVHFCQDRHGDVKLELTIDVDNFAFMLDGYFDAVERKLAEAKPPEDDLIGRAE